MQVIIEIPDELAAQARLRGLTPEGYVRSLVDDAVRTTLTVSGPIRPKNRIDMQTFLRKMAVFSEKIPQLPDEAFTRESFYQDHD